VNIISSSNDNEDFNGSSDAIMARTSSKLLPWN
jgi:hypothetical protein